jgi:hypothetical protein
MFGWIPIIGPIVDGVVSIWKGYQNVDIQKYTIDGKVDVAAMQASVANIQATKDDIGIRLLRDLALTPAVVWIALIGWDTIISSHYPNLMWHVNTFPSSVSYYPGLALGFLLGNIGLNIWRRK